MQHNISKHAKSIYRNNHTHRRILKNVQADVYHYYIIYDLIFYKQVKEKKIQKSYNHLNVLAHTGLASSKKHSILIVCIVFDYYSML